MEISKSRTIALNRLNKLKNKRDWKFLNVCQCCGPLQYLFLNLTASQGVFKLFSITNSRMLLKQSCSVLYYMASLPVVSQANTQGFGSNTTITESAIYLEITSTIMKQNNQLRK